MDIRRKIHNLMHPKLGKILMLHSVSSPKILESLVSQCRDEGYETVSLDEAVTRFHKRDKRRFACFTFDDGYFDTYSVAYPTLGKLGTPFCIYMTRDFYRGVSQPIWDPSSKMMNVEQLKKISESPLCTIGVHSCSHPHLSELNAIQQRREIVECKSDLEDLLGKEIRNMAYPHGDYNQITVEIVSELGFITAVTTSGRHIRSDSKLLEFDRVFA